MIKEVIDKLRPDERRLLMYAFEQEFSQYIRLPGNTFVGVNTQSIKNLEVLETAGKWTYGRVKG